MALPTPLVELFIDEAWVDITSYVKFGPKFTLKRGEADEHGRLTTTTAMCTLRNDKPGSVGIWSNKNPSSIYFGKLVPGLPIRFKMGTATRAVLAVRSFAPHWSAGEKSAWVVIIATGILGQLAQGGKALDSPVYRDVMRLHNDTFRVAYWPMEEESRATRYESASGALPLAVDSFSSISLAAFASPGSRNLSTLATGVRITATIPSYDTSEHKFVQLWNIPSAHTDLTVLCRLICSGGAIGYIDLIYGTVSGGSLKMSAYTSGGTLIDESTFFAFGVDGMHFLTSLEFTQSGSNVNVVFVVQEIDVDNPQSGVQGSDTWATTIGTVTHYIIGPNANLNGISVGHLAVSNDTNGIAGLADATVGHVGETAGSRLQRLCDEEDITLFSTTGGSFAITQPMGIQGRDTLIDLFNEILTVDQGVIRETRTVYALTYAPGYTLENQVESVALDYDASHLGPEMLEPTTDDFLVHNDVTVRRPDGSFARAFLDEGRLSVNAPPDGIGTYDRGPITANTETDDQLLDLAGWILNVRTPDDERWPKIQVELARSPFEASSTLRDEVIGTDIAEIIALENLPLFVAPETHYGIVRGYREECNSKLWTITFYTSPYWPYEVTPMETSGSTLANAPNAASTSWKLDTSSGFEWDTTYEPYHIQAGGEAVRVTAMVTDTPAFIAAGAAAHADNASVSPGLPAGMTVDSGQLLLCWAAIRNSGTGTVNLPAGWTDIVQFGNTRLFGRYYRTGDVAPTVTFAGGVAGATCSAQLYGFSGTSLYAEFTSTQLNSSAQDINFPAGLSGLIYNRRANRMLLWAGWKQDDWTSAAVLGGGFASEAGEASSTTGDDQAIVLDYFMQATPAQSGSGTIAITGGASAISRGVVLGLRPLQTATVVRGVNGVNVAQSVGADVKTWRLGVSAL
jgi:hypothetical protein